MKSRKSVHFVAKKCVLYLTAYSRLLVIECEWYLIKILLIVKQIMQRKPGEGH